jgi:hypothetical protein
MAVSWQTLLKLEVFGPVDRAVCISFLLFHKKKAKKLHHLFFANHLFSANTQERGKNKLITRKKPLQI